MRLRVSVLLAVGVVADGVIVDSIRPVDAAAAGILAAGGGGYQVEVTYVSPEFGQRVQVRAFQRLDVFPFGWSRPSKVFGHIGRHTTRGIITGFDEELCTYQTADPVSGEASSWVLGELELLPPLTGFRPTVPLPVGTHVIARRHGQGGLHRAEVVAANGDLTYTLRYEESGVAEDSVLHRDVARPEQLDRAFQLHVAKSTTASPRREIPERVSVRSVVLVALIGQHLATIVQCLGNNRYRALLLSTQKVVLVSESHITAARPVLHDALDADPEAVKMFISADEGLTGTVTWAATKRSLKESTRAFGLPISDNRMRDIYAELAIAARGTGAVPIGKGRTVVEDGDFPLAFADFELAFRRYRNAV